MEDIGLEPSPPRVALSPPEGNASPASGNASPGPDREPEENPAGEGERLAGREAEALSLGAADVEDLDSGRQGLVADPELEQRRPLHLEHEHEDDREDDPAPLSGSDDAELLRHRRDPAPAPMQLHRHGEEKLQLRLHRRELFSEHRQERSRDQDLDVIDHEPDYTDESGEEEVVEEEVLEEVEDLLEEGEEEVIEEEETMIEDEEGDETLARPRDQAVKRPAPPTVAVLPAVKAAVAPAASPGKLPAEKGSSESRVTEPRAATMEDAPAGHNAWRNVRYDETRGIWSMESVRGGQPARFQVTLKSAHGSVEDGARIARLCYMRFESGEAKDQLKAYRDDLYQKCGGRITAGSDHRPQLRMESAAPVVARTGPAAEVAAPVEEGPPDAPPESRGHRCVKLDAEKRHYVVRLFSGGRFLSMTVSVEAAGGNVAEAGRVARLCYAMLEAGAAKDDTLNFRKGLLAAGPAGALPTRPSLPLLNDRPQVLNLGPSKPPPPVAGAAPPLLSSNTAPAPPSNAPGRIAIDAHPMSAAHQRVKFDPTRREWRLQLSRDGQVLRTQVSVAAANGSEADAGRIARLLYAKLEAGESKGAVLRLREELCQQCGGQTRAARRSVGERSEDDVDGPPERSDRDSREPRESREQREPREHRELKAAGPATSSAAGAPRETSTRSPRTPRSTRHPGKAANDPQSSPDSDDEGESVSDDDADESAAAGRDLYEDRDPQIFEDAPPDNPSHQKVKFNAARGIWVIHMHHEGQVIRMQTSVAGAYGSVGDAGRIARLCYIRLEAGDSKEEAVKYRERMYLKCMPPAAPAGSPLVLAVPPEPEDLTLRRVAEDAPRESGAHSKVRFEPARGMWRLRYARGGQVVRAQVTLAAAGNNVWDGGRIARLCYAKLEAGASKSSVLRYRDELYARCCAPGPPPGAEIEEVSAESFIPRHDRPPKPALAPVHGGLPEDLPEDHPAHLHVKFRESRNVWIVPVRDTATQVVVRASECTVEDAGVVARHCYVRLEAGENRERVLRYRDDLLERCSRHPPRAVVEEVEMQPAMKRRRPIAEELPLGPWSSAPTHSSSSRAVHAPPPRLRMDGSPIRTVSAGPGAVAITGRDTARNAASINGAYALLPEPFAAAPAYEKADGSKKRFLFFSNRVRGWKVSDSLDDARPGFAFARAIAPAAGGPATPADLGDAAAWRVFGRGGGDGYRRDPAVRCTRLAGGFGSEGGTSAEAAANFDKARNRPPDRSRSRSPLRGDRSRDRSPGRRTSEADDSDGSAAGSRAMGEGIRVTRGSLAASGSAVAGAQVAGAAPVPSASGQDDGAAASGEAVSRHAPRITEDAPVGHPAHRRVKYQATRGLWIVKVQRGAAEYVNMQTSVRAANRSPEDAGRIARLCYMKLDEGMSREDAMRFRDDLYLKCGAKPNPSKRDWPGGSEKNGEVSHTKSSEKAANGVSDDTSRAARLCSDKLQEPRGRRAPDEQAGLDKLRAAGRIEGAVKIVGRNPNRNAASINGFYALIPGEGGLEGTKQYEKCDGSKRRYLFFSRFRGGCWKISDKLADGTGYFAWSKELMDVATWHVYDEGAGYLVDPSVRCRKVEDPGASGSRSASPGGRSASSSRDGASDGESGKEGHGAGKEAAGPAAAVAVPASAAETGENDDAPKGHEAHRRVKYSQPRGTWSMKVNGVRVETSPKATGDNVFEAGRVARLCYLQLQAGSQRQDVLKFRDDLYKRYTCNRKPRGKRPRSEDRPAAAKGRAKAVAKGKAKRRRRARSSGSDTSQSSSSDGDADDSSSDSTKAAPGAATPSGAKPATATRSTPVAAAPAPAPAAAAAATTAPAPAAGEAVPAVEATSSGAPQGSKIPVRKICAKMLVRTGLRCACHYALRQDCPDA